MPCAGWRDRHGACLHRADAAEVSWDTEPECLTWLRRSVDVAVITRHRRRAFWLPGWWGGGENKSYHSVKRNKFNMRPSIDLTSIDRAPTKCKAPSWAPTFHKELQYFMLLLLQTHRHLLRESCTSVERSQVFIKDLIDYSKSGMVIRAFSMWGAWVELRAQGWGFQTRLHAGNDHRIEAFRPCLPPMHLTVETQSGPEMNQFPLPVSLNLMNRAFA